MPGSSRITSDGYFQPIRCEGVRDIWGDVCGPIETQSDDVIVGPEYCIHARPPWLLPVPKSGLGPLQSLGNLVKT